MRRFKFLTPVLAVLALAGCGGGSHAVTHPSRAARLAHTLPNGQQAPASWSVRGGRPRSPGFVSSAEAPGAPARSLLGGTLTISGYDAVTLRNILSYTSSPQAVGCYIVGTYANCPEARSRFPHAHIVSITPTASFVSVGTKCLDTETGDSTPGQVVGWIRAEIRVGVYRPCDYAPLDEMVFQVEPLLRASGLPRSSYLLWVAHWTNIFGVELGFDAQQYFSNCCVDKDAFLSYFFASKPAPPPNAPGCSTPSIRTSYCWGRFTTLDWFNRPAGSKTAKVKPWCYYGCVERSLVKRLTGEIFAAQTPAGLKPDLARAKAVCGRLTYLEQHRSVKENGDTYTYGRKKNVCGRSKDIPHKAWYYYL